MTKFLHRFGYFFCLELTTDRFEAAVAEIDRLIKTGYIDCRVDQPTVVQIGDQFGVYLKA